MAKPRRISEFTWTGISNYGPNEARQMLTELKKLGTPCLVEQSRYNMLERNVEDGLLDVIEEEKIGFVAFSPLAKGILTSKQAEERGQTLAQYALSWILKDPRVTSVIIGASRPEQILENIKVISNE